MSRPSSTESRRRSPDGITLDRFQDHRQSGRFESAIAKLVERPDETEVISKPRDAPPPQLLTVLHAWVSASSC